MLGHLIYNHHHLDDVRIQQELSRQLYGKAFGGVHLVHAYNGKPSFGYRRYLEDTLIRLPNPGHFQGACDLINAGVLYFARLRRPVIRYLLVTAADTWMIKVSFLNTLIRDMERQQKVLAASSWGSAKAPERPRGLSLDFFLLDMRWQRAGKIFPIDYPGFVRKFADYFYLDWRQPVVEAAFQYRVERYFAERYQDNDIWRMRERSFRRIVEREPVHPKHGVHRRQAWPAIGLYTSPTPNEKRLALKRFKLDLGPYSHKLITARSLAYYNRLGR